MRWFVIFVLCIHSALNEGQSPAVNPTPTDSDSDEATQLGNNEFERAEVVFDNGNSSQANASSSQPAQVSTENWTSSDVSTLMEIFANESQSPEFISVVTATEEEATSMTSVVATSDQGVNETITTADDDEIEGVARGKPSSTESGNVTATSAPETIYQKTWALISDTYTLSIIIPIAAGVVFASTIILVIATCRCIRRRCRRRRLRRKALPDSVKNLRPSDRARLLAESSDEEF